MSEKNISLLRIREDEIDKYNTLISTFKNDEFKKIIGDNIYHDGDSAMMFKYNDDIDSNLNDLTMLYVKDSLDLNFTEAVVLLNIRTLKYTIDIDISNFEESYILTCDLFDKILDILEKSNLSEYEGVPGVEILISRSINNRGILLNHDVMSVRNFNINMRCFNIHFDNKSEDISKTLVDIHPQNSDVVKSLIYKYKTEGMTEEVKSLISDYLLMQDIPFDLLRFEYLDSLYLAYITSLDDNYIPHIKRYMGLILMTFNINLNIIIPYSNIISSIIFIMKSIEDLKWFNNGIFKIFEKMMEGRFDIIVKDIESGENYEK